MRLPAFVALLTTACGGSYPRNPTRQVGGGDELPRGVEAAALPYAIVDGHTGAAVEVPVNDELPS